MFKNGKPDGPGVILYPDGRIYDGEIKYWCQPAMENSSRCWERDTKVNGKMANGTGKGSFIAAHPNQHREG
jgi:hypothetical protein